MRKVNPAKAFTQALQSRQNPEPDENYKKLLELTRQYRQAEEAWFAKIKRNEFAINEKDRMMEKRRQLDYLISTIHL